MNSLLQDSYTSSDNLKIEYWHKPRELFPRYYPPYTGVALPCHTTAEFTIVRENRYAKAAKWLNYSREVQTGDIAFDPAYYIISCIPVATSAFLSTPENRKAITTLFQLGFRQVKVDKNILSADLSSGKDLKKTEAGRRILDQTAAAMHLLATNNPKSPDPEQDKIDLEKSNRRRLNHVFAALLIFTIGTTAVFFHLKRQFDYELIQFFPLFKASLLISIPTFLMLFTLTAYLLKGGSRSHLFLSGYATILLPLSIVAGYSGLSYANSKFDESSPIEHRLLVNNKRATNGKHARRFYVTHQAITPLQGVRTTEVSATQFYRASPGESFIVVKIRQGRYGFPWIESRRIVQPREFEPLGLHEALERYR